MIIVLVIQLQKWFSSYIEELSLCLKKRWPMHSCSAVRHSIESNSCIRVKLHTIQRQSKTFVENKHASVSQRYVSSVYTINRTKTADECRERSLLVIHTRKSCCFLAFWKCKHLFSLKNKKKTAFYCIHLPSWLTAFLSNKVKTFLRSLSHSEISFHKALYEGRRSWILMGDTYRGAKRSRKVWQIV